MLYYIAWPMLMTEFVFSGALLSICVQKHRVPWLQGSFDLSIVDDEDDVWKIKDYQYFKETKEDGEEKNKPVKVAYKMLQILGMFICFASILLTFLFHGLTFVAHTQKWPEETKWSDIFNLMTICICLIIELACLGMIVFRSYQKRFSSKDRAWIPRFMWIIAPYLYTTGALQFLSTKSSTESTIEQRIEASELDSNWTFLLGLAYILFIMVLFGIAYNFFGFLVNIPSIRFFWQDNFWKNPNRSRKLLRIMDTTASILMLTGMLLGFASLFINQYDIELEADGDLQKFNQTIQKFRFQMKGLQTEFKRINDNVFVLSCQQEHDIIVGKLKQEY